MDINPHDFVIEDIFDGAPIGWRIDWPAYHAACDARDAKPALTVIEGGKGMDIVERLRAEGADTMRKHYSLGMWQLCDEAAAEIERLREGRDTMGNLWAKEKAENERLLKELQKIANMDFRGNRSPESVIAYRALQHRERVT